MPEEDLSLDISEGDILNLEIERDENIKLKIWINPKLEELLATDETSESHNWKVDGEPAEYYTNTSYNQGDLRDKLYGNYNDYGKQLYSGAINVALLRTVGISDDGGILLEIPNNITKEGLESGIRELKEFVRELWQDFIQNIHITCQLTQMEV